MEQDTSGRSTKHRIAKAGSYVLALFGLLAVFTALANVHYRISGNEPVYVYIGIFLQVVLGTGAIYYSVRLRGYSIPVQSDFLLESEGKQ